VSDRPLSSWAALYAAMLLDVAQVFALDFSDGFRNSVVGALAIAAFGVEVTLFSLALRHIDSAIAYGLYGLGTAGVAAISIGWLGEALTVTKGIALAAVILGAVLLNTDGAKPPTVPAKGDQPASSARTRAAARLSARSFS
jgi:multidrug transporter EmrE-like cation transporter